jgi:MerR family transcriptional regulator, light-induced transcriptional regulator
MVMTRSRGPDVPRADAEETRGPGSRARLSIGALSRATAIPVDTLRTWERRYGYPVPERTSSGHRLYPLDAVARLQRIAEALAAGHRASQVVAATDVDLAALLQGAPAAPASTTVGSVDAGSLLDATVRLDSQGLLRPLLTEWARLGPLDFLRGRLGPLLDEVGEAWAAGRLAISREHFLAERIGDLLRTLRMPFDERARGPLFVLATLPGESHALGLQMVALLLATLGHRVCYLGTEVPVSQVATLVDDLDARAAAVSVSAATRGRRVARQLAQLRRVLPAHVELVVGGAGAPESCAGVRVIRDLEALHVWASTIGRRARGAESPQVRTGATDGRREVGRGR